ncbi:50S ribosome-binding GTPase [Candidatus Pacearchaeota archaeon]|nr:50S ribosome-binding GTPase [Candidatus Pacearchaeota archaeon]
MRVRYSFSSRRTGIIEGTNKHREPFPKIAREVISMSDLILEVLDARFLDLTRNVEIEKVIKQNGKGVIYVFNKADLVDIKKTTEKAGVLELNPYVFVSCKARSGGKDLRNRIKQEIRSLGIVGRRAQVGVIGYPNTGKSSVINLLIGKKSARTAEIAGFTKGIQKLRLTSDIVVLDTPGVIPEQEKGISRDKVARHSEVGARSYEKVKDPEFVVDRLMKRYPGIIERFYNIDANGNSELLIEELGRKNNFLIKGGSIDSDRTARLVLKDWQRGNIRIE